MRRLISAVLVVIIATSLLLPILPAVGKNDPYPLNETGASPISSRAAIPQTSGIIFPEPLNTSADVREYPLISRALMLQSGSSDSIIADMNGDGRPDLVVAQYNAKVISMFFRNADGDFNTYASLNISTRNSPYRIITLDAFADGSHQIAALERDTVFSGTRLAVYNVTSETSYEQWPDTATYANAVSLVTGNLTGDKYPDIAIACAGSDPSVLAGVVQIYAGPPYFSLYTMFYAGLGVNTIIVNDLNRDSIAELAVSNYYSVNVMLFRGPFSLISAPYQTLNVSGHPTGLTSGMLDGNTREDIAVITNGPSAIRFFFQDLSGFQDFENENRSLDVSPSFIVSGNFSGDSGDDLLILSGQDNVSLGFVQHSPGVLWFASPDFRLPTNAFPRTAVIGELNGDTMPDIAVTNARSDWSGSSIAIYPNRYPERPIFCNGNTTAWTNRSASPSMIATGDLDGNGIVDLVTLNVQNGTFDYILNFTDSIRTQNLWYTPGELVVYDFNNDNCSEVVTTDAGSPLMTVFYWRNNTSPSIVTNLSANGTIMDIALGDFNDDGLEDIMVSTDDGRLDFFFNDGSAEPFQSLYEYAPTLGSGIWSLTVGDFNNDGLDDIAYTKSIRKIIVMLQSPSLPFGPTSVTRSLSYNQGADFTTIWAGDVTGDNKTDLVAMRPSDPSLYLFDQNDFVVSPYPFGMLVLPEVPKFVSVMDFTDDGHADVAAMFGSTDLLFLYRQNGSSLPESPSMVFVTGAGANYVTIGDGTGDRRGDLLTNDIGSHSVSIWEQINFPPVAYAGGPYYARQGDEFQFNGSAETGTSERLYTSFRWDFGDGNVATGMMLSRPKHVYTEVRQYNVTLQVTDPAGLTSTNRTTVDVLDSYPHVGFTWSPLEPNEGQTVSFTSTTTSFDPVVSALWYIDGVISGNGSSLAVEFQDGTSVVSLEATDSDGSVVRLNQTVVVRSMPPDLRILGPNSSAEGQEVNFTVLVDEWHGGPVDPIALYEWDFYYFPGFFIPNPFATNSSTVSHIFSASFDLQNYSVAVRVTDTDGAQNVTFFNITIFETGPAAAFTLNTSDPQEGVPLKFISNASSYDGIVNWSWVLRYPDGHSELFLLTGDEMADMVFSDLDAGLYTMTLTVLELDGDVNTSNMTFLVREIPPFVSLETVPDPLWAGYFEEFYTVSFVANASGLDPVVLYEWDFDAPGAEFVADGSSTVGEANHLYGAVGNYTAKVRVTDSDNQSRIVSVYVEIKNKEFVGDFDSLVWVTRNPLDTDYVTFDLAVLLYRYPDVVWAHYYFGDGLEYTDSDYPIQSVEHHYVLGADHRVAISVRDDDSVSYTITQIIWNRPPTIQLIAPEPNAVIHSGTPILFLINTGSTPIHSASYDIDGGGALIFGQMYKIDTTGWVEWNHSVVVTALDYGGNIVSYTTNMIVDDSSPRPILSSSKTSLFGGDKFNVTIRVDDLNVVSDGITLYVRFQGETAFSTFGVKKAKDGEFYRVLDVPVRKGMIEFYANVTDLAGNPSETPLYQMSVEIHFIDRAWPYLLTVAVLAALGIAGYFTREVKMAIDETFVIYKDGRMISHSTRRLKPSMDDQILGGMLVAIQDFVKDSFKDITSFTLRKLEFGEKSVLIEKGDHVYLAVILHGNASRKVALKMQRAVDEIELEFGKYLKDWDGDLDAVRGVNRIVKSLYSKMPVLPGSLRRDT